MRLLKKKINAAVQKREARVEPLNKPLPKPSITKPFLIIRQPIQKKESGFSKSSPQDTTAFAKNIVKNYGKAMSAFAASQYALPYLGDLAKKEGVDDKKFLNFIVTYKESVDSIDSLRALLVIYDDDTKEMASFKKIFKGLCEVFLKYFAVNWIFHGKMHHKLQHLKYRHKMLRRVRKPEMFTYLTSKIK